MIKAIFEYLANQYEKIPGTDNPVYRCVKWMIRTYIWYLDQYVKYINDNAYIQIALTSCTFCDGTYQAFYLIVRHAGRFGSTAMISNIMCSLGKGFICATITYLTLIIVENHYQGC